MRGMILAAGIGSRLKPLTDKKPKALVSLGEYTMLQLAVLYLKKYGIKEVIINIHHFADQIIDYINSNSSFGIEIKFSDEKEELLNTGGGLVKASDFLKSSKPFVLMAVDVLTDLNLKAALAHHQECKNLVTLGVKDRETTRSLLFDQDMRLCGWRHNASGELKIVSGKKHTIARGFSGIHIINPEIFDMITEVGNFSIIDLYLRLAKEEKIGSFDHSEGEWMEFGRVSSVNNVKEDQKFKELISHLFN